ncbi:MAG: hypothetical protein WAT78_05655 [Rhizobiaceae bacterium]
MVTDDASRTIIGQTRKYGISRNTVAGANDGGERLSCGFGLRKRLQKRQEQQNDRQPRTGNPVAAQVLQHTGASDLAHGRLIEQSAAIGKAANRLRRYERQHGFNAANKLGCRSIPSFQAAPFFRICREEGGSPQVPAGIPPVTRTFANLTTLLAVFPLQPVPLLIRSRK